MNISTLFGRTGFITTCALAILLTTNFLHAGGMRANGTLGGNLVHIGVGAPSAPGLGDFVASSTGLDLPHLVFIEVTPGTTQLQVEIFDADVPTGGSQETSTGLDGNNDSGSVYIYRLRDPSGAVVRTRSSTALGGLGPVNNAWNAIFPSMPIATPTPGHWTVEIDSTAGGTANAYGVRAFETSPGPGDRELNVYYQIGNHGKTTTGTNQRVYTEYAWITSGCSCTMNDFDLDRNSATTGASYRLVSPSGAANLFVPNVLTSPNGAWASNTLTGWTSDSFAGDYGIWTFTPIVFNGSGASQNYSNFYIAYDSNTVPAPDLPNPASNLPIGSFRIYFPTDANTAPVKPHMEQSLDIEPGTGPNPPQVGMTTRVRVLLRVTNPTAFPIAFAPPIRIVEAMLPSDSTTTYQGVDQVSQGVVIGQPGIGATSGNIAWNPGIVAAGTNATLSYFIDFTPINTSRTLMTGSPASDGTTAVYLDETANTSQSRAQITLGPLCELAVTANGTPLFVELDSFDAVSNGVGQPVSLSWTTAMEVDNVGFHIYRAADGAGRSQEKGERLTSSIIPAQGNGAGASYQFVDTAPLASADESRAYLLEDIDLNSTRTLHGPFRLTDPSGQVSNVDEWTDY